MCLNFFKRRTSVHSKCKTCILSVSPLQSNPAKARSNHQVTSKPTSTHTYRLFRFLKSRYHFSRFAASATRGAHYTVTAESVKGKLQHFISRLAATRFVVEAKARILPNKIIGSIAICAFLQINYIWLNSG